MASSSTEISPKFFDRVSLGLVGRVGKAHAVICSGVTAIRSKVMSASLARGMLKDIRVATTSIVCSGCGSDFTARCNPLAALIVLVPQGPERKLDWGLLMSAMHQPRGRPEGYGRRFHPNLAWRAARAYSVAPQARISLREVPCYRVLVPSPYQSFPASTRLVGRPSYCPFASAPCSPPPPSAFLRPPHPLPQPIIRPALNASLARWSPRPPRRSRRRWTSAATAGSPPRLSVLGKI